MDFTKKSSEGITDIDADHGKAVSVTYYDTFGRQHAQPVDGITIRRTIYSDGTVTTEKIRLH